MPDVNALADLASASPWTYAVVFAFAALDSLVLIVPSETVLVAAAALAASAELSLFGVIGAAAAGAVLGDTGAYGAGRSLGPRLRRVTGGKLRERLDWAERQLDERGSTVIVVSRFIPGGRTATMITAGAVTMPWRRFLGFVAAAGAIWACYGGLIGYLGGSAFEDQTWAGLALALGIALILALVLESARRLIHRRRAVEI